MTVQHSLVQKHMLHQFEPGYDVTKAVKNIYGTKDESVVNHITVKQMVQEILYELQEP